MLRKRGRHMLIVLSIIVSLMIMIILVILPPSLGKIQPFKDENGRVLLGSIAEKTKVEINGIDQGLIIKGKDINKPVLLIVHGGPGLPFYFLTNLYETSLEDEFVVCYWDQRGTGLSYQKDMDIKMMNTEQFISDTIEVTKYLKSRFNQEKIYLLGHSWGTYLGLMAVKREPEHYHAYIAMSQVVNQVESELEAYAYMYEQYTSKNNQKMMKKLDQYDVYNIPTELMQYRQSALRDEVMHDLGVGTMHDMKSVITGLFFPSLRCKAYTMSERIDIWRGKVYSRSTEMLYTIDDFDAREDVDKLEIPIYFFAGIYDYTTTYSLQRAYYDLVDAPIKGFYTFNHSAHSPILEEPEHAMKILVEDVLNYRVSLED